MESKETMINAVVGISICGNDIVETNEDCESSDLRGYTCTDLGFESGQLSCDIACSFNTSMCLTNPTQSFQSRILSTTYVPLLDHSNSNFTLTGSFEPLLNFLRVNSPISILKETKQFKTSSPITLKGQVLEKEQMHELVEIPFVDESSSPSNIQQRNSKSFNQSSITSIILIIFFIILLLTLIFKKNN